MADLNDLFFFGEDFDAILDVIDADEAFEEEFNTAVSQSQCEEIICEFCGKKCKSKGGLSRHKTAKHNASTTNTSNLQLTHDILVSLVNDAVQKISKNKVYSLSLREEISYFSYTRIAEDSEEFDDLNSIYKNLMKNGDPGKFYARYYGKIALKATRFFRGLSQEAATLLSTKLADRMLAYRKEQHCPNVNSNKVSGLLSDRQKAGLQYIGGYVLHKLHNKYRNSKCFESTDCEQAMAILKAGKLHTKGSMESQQLTSALNRGGLWSITLPTENIFLKTEYYFRMCTSKPGLKNINFASIANKSTDDSDLLSNYSLLLSEAELIPNSCISKDILQSIVNLYVRVRSFSFAKDIIQKHKIVEKQTKAKALRKEISRSCKEQEEERNK